MFITVTPDNKRRKRLRRKRNRKKRGLAYCFTRSKRQRILKRDGYRCLNCAEPDQAKLTLDHIDPKAEGDKNRDDNLQTLCVLCNQRKGQNVVDYRA